MATWFMIAKPAADFISPINSAVLITLSFVRLEKRRELDENFRSHEKPTPLYLCAQPERQILCAQLNLIKTALPLRIPLPVAKFCDSACS